MWLTKLLIVLLAKVAQVLSTGKGCSFVNPYDLVKNPEPQGLPLLVDISILVIGLRDVAESGGSFGVDVEYDDTRPCTLSMVY